MVATGPSARKGLRRLECPPWVKSRHYVAQSAMSALLDTDCALETTDEELRGSTTAARLPPRPLIERRPLATLTLFNRFDRGL
jgi:hypothetical protein